MTKEELIDRINDIEWEDFEAKEAKSELPKNIWETVSAFANTSGGWIVLGIKQNGKKFEISGVDNAEKLEQDFWVLCVPKSSMSQSMPRVCSII
ncbi:AlbA family DNA-binding domain-containing protein [Segatella copri]|uniref:AlbA family DNA-binding domain-containing protein n=1 Tax=Segatella copri TaxID=165179 RepID=UPI001C48194C|nr:ATP-binding protein [Segatella copri]MBW0024646.1 ATP-binding protein [Segatella copri]